MFGTVAGLVLIAASLSVIPIWSILAFPIVHAAPGLVGHRLFDRDEELGDLRITRTDYPLWWFIIANHLLTFDVLTMRQR